MREAERFAQRVGIGLLVVWGLWWLDALVHLNLRGADATWLRVPFFGADFTTQPDWAVRVWASGESPYDVESQVFHYPPIVIQLFRWALFFDTLTALRIWIVILAGLIVAGTVVAHRNRVRLGLPAPPLALLLSLVLFSFPVVFALERSNFDLITLAAILAALPLMARPSGAPRVLAGALLAVGPWVKIYPGLIGLGLVALRRWRALVGFVVGGVGISLLEPTELAKSFRELSRVIIYYSRMEIRYFQTFAPWGHSLSMLVRKVLRNVELTLHVHIDQVFRASLVAMVLIAPLVGWVVVRIYQCNKADVLAFPLFCWIVAAASFVPEVANDYSLVFLPIAAVTVCRWNDGWSIRAGMLFALPAFQPVALPINGFILLAMKVSGLMVVGESLVRRARELAPAPAVDAAGDAAASDPTASAGAVESA